MKNFKLRKRFRRVIMSMAVSHELEMTEIRFEMLNDSVDLFVIAEGNMTQGLISHFSCPTFILTVCTCLQFLAGTSKPFNVMNAFKDGYLKKFWHKLLYIQQGNYPPDFIRDGWKAEK